MFYRRYLNHQFAADMYMARTKSLHGNTCPYIFAHKSGLPGLSQANKTKSSDLLRQFAIIWGIPRKLIVVGALEQVGQNTEYIKRCCTYDINLHVSSPGKPCIIREGCKKWYRVCKQLT
jgi:hypothetical protein